MATTKQLYGREGNVVIRGIPEAKFQDREVNYFKTKRGSEIYLCDKCFCECYEIDERKLAIMRASQL